ncbi:MAG: hypothetical protein KDK10_11755 [Maritimibacter sp.]|nr:hypothetical protein [Maritimibacter sp.]
MSGHRKVTRLTRERAFATIKVLADAMLKGEKAVSYSDLANRLEMANATGRGLGPVLDEAGAMCIERGLPDVSVVVVTKESLALGEPMPSEESFKDGIWARTGMSREEVPLEQDRVRSFDWTSVRELRLGEPKQHE